MLLWRPVSVNGYMTWLETTLTVTITGVSVNGYTTWLETTLTVTITGVSVNQTCELLQHLWQCWSRNRSNWKIHGIK